MIDWERVFRYLAKPGSWCGTHGPTDVPRLLLDVVQLAAAGLDARPYEAPRAHVLRLLLDPAHLSWF